MLYEHYPVNGAFPPEGRCATAACRAELQESAGTGAIFNAIAVKCQQGRDLVVDLGDCRGIIPRREAALGADGDGVRDIAVISRVGKPVCFTVLETLPDGDLLLSRRAAQEAAMAAFIKNLRPGDVLGGRVTHLERFGVFVDIGCGVTSFIGIENISVSRIPHPSHRFAQGQDILAAVLEIDRQTGRITLTHRELLGTWLQNARDFHPGDTVQGVVRGVEEYGMFIELTPNLSGLSEVRPGFGAGDRVSVYIKSLSPQRMKVKLAAVERLPPAPPRLIAPGDYFLPRGRLAAWQYSPPGCTRQLGHVFAST